MAVNYLAPTLSFSDGETIDQFLATWSTNQSSYVGGRNTTSYETLVHEKCAGIFGEPGFGKSRLLQELYFLQEKKGKKVIFLDLKRVGSQSIREYLDARVKDTRSYQPNEWAFKVCADFKIEDLSDYHLLLDALDEVALEHIPRIIWEIQQLLEEGKVQISLSCRTHHAERFIQEFRNIEMNYYSIRPFSPYQVATYLKLCSPQLSDFTTGDIMDKLDKHYNRNGFFDWSSTLNTPRYLEYFGELLDSYSFEYVAGLTRCELFERFIKARFKAETEKRKVSDPGYARKIPYLKQCFQRIALVMEIQRTNRISKDDLASFDIDARLNIGTQLRLELFYDGTILKDSGDYLEFDNTEFQEYLAAIALSRIGRTEQVVFDLAIDKKLEKVYPSWFNPISFLIELENSLLSPMISFAIRSEDPTLFTLLNFAPTDTYDDDQKSKYFDQVLNYYITKKYLFRERLVSGMGKFFLPKKHEAQLYELIEGAVSSLDHFVYGTTVAEILSSYLGQNGRTEDLHLDWASKMLASIDQERVHGTTLNSTIFRLLPLICTPKQLEEKGFHLNRTEGDIFKGCVAFYVQAAPNSPTGIDLFLAKVEKEHSVGYNSVFNNITSKEGFSHLFDRLFTPEIYRRIQLSSYGNTNILSDTVVEHLFEIYDDDIEKRLLEGINTLYSSWHIYQSFLLDRVVEILEMRTGNVILKLLNNLPAIDDKYGEVHDNYGYLFARLLKTNAQLEQLKEILLRTETGRKVLLKALIHAKQIDCTPSIEEHFPEQIAYWAENNKQLQVRNVEFERRTERRADEQLEQFRRHLNNSSIAISTFYLNLSDQHKAKLTPSEQRKVHNLLVRILEENEPLTGRVSVEDTGDNARKITQSRLIQDFKDAVLLIPSFDISPTPYRRKILQALLFTYADEEVATLLQLIPDISLEEVEQFVEEYGTAREDDLIEESVSRFVSMCERNEILLQRAYPLLKGWAIAPEIRYYDRIRTISVLAKATKNSDWLNQVFAFYKQKSSSEDQRKLLQSINLELLHLEDFDAVKWRMELVLSNLYDREESNQISVTGRFVPDFEGLGRPLGSIKSSRFLDLILWYLEASFKALIASPTKYKCLKEEVWAIVTPYFLEAKLSRSQELYVLEQLDLLMEKYGENHRVHWFYDRIDRIRLTYMERRGEATSFGDAVKQYLEVQRKQYLDIHYPVEVFTLVQEVINDDLRSWVAQGAYSFVGTVSNLSGGLVKREELIQKSIVTQLDNYLLRKGFRAADTTIIDPVICRENQLLDDRRVDLVITYGAIGSVMVEIKRMGNGDLATGELVDYKAKFMAYLKQTHCGYGIFLIFLDREDKRGQFQSKLEELRSLYQEANIAVIGIDCLGEMSGGN